MASNYGPWVAGDDWRSWVGVTITSETATTATVQVQGWFGAQAGSSTGNGNVKGWVGCKRPSDSDIQWSGAVNIDPFSEGSSKYYKTQSWSVTKTTSTQTVTGYADVEGTAGIYSGRKSQASASVTVSTLAKYTITYNANGGTNAPAAGSKWHGQTFTITSSKPTRTNYNFAGWNTKADGTGTNYASGGTIAAGVNEATTLYAKWTLAATSPQITKLNAYRSDSSGNRVTTAGGTTTSHITIEYGWSLDTGITSNNNRNIQITLGGTAKSAIALTANSGSSGKITYEQSLAVGGTLNVSATLRDTLHGLSATKSTAVGTLFKPFSMANGGKAAAFFGFANAAWDKVLRIFGSMTIEASDAALRFYSTAINTKIGTNVPSANVVLQTEEIYDNTGVQSYYSQLWRTKDDDLYKSYVLRRQNASGTEITGGFYTHLLANGQSSIGFTGTNTARNWHKAISPWTSIATTSGETAKTFSDVNTAGYSELLVVAKSGTKYRSSVVIPVAELDTTLRDWYLGGGTWSNHWGACCAMTRTQIKPYKIQLGSAATKADWTVYAR